MRRSALVLLAISPLAACASNERRLDDAWNRFQTEYTSVETHAERVRVAAVEDARTTGDDRRLVFLTIPPESPISRAMLASSLASTAYVAGDLERMEWALHALRQCDADISRIERELAATNAP